jgi:3-dehydroquinate dehydratase-2
MCLDHIFRVYNRKNIKQMKRIQIINGPNLNLLGKREPTVYGNQTFETYLIDLRALFPEVELDYFQSNSEGDLIDKLHEVGFSYDGIVLNAGAYTHTSIAIADAIRSIQVPVIEVHISNVFKRESYRHHSYLSEACKGCIIGFGMDSYRLAVNALLQL